MNRHSGGFEQRGFSEGQVLRQTMHDSRRNRNKFGERSSPAIVPARNAEDFTVVAQIDFSAQAGRTFTAIDCRIKCDAIPFARPARILTNGGYYSRGFVPHDDWRNPASGRTIVAVDVAATNSARCYADQHFIASNGGNGQIRDLQMEILGEQQSFHFAFFAGDVGGPTIPSPSRIVRIWFGLIFVNRSTFCVVGHFTSITSMVWAPPSPKCSRRSLCDITLDPLRTSSIWAGLPVTTRARAPIAVRLHLVPISLILIQFCLLPPSFRNSDGTSFIFKTKAWTSPSLS